MKERDNLTTGLIVVIISISIATGCSDSGRTIAPGSAQGGGNLRIETLVPSRTVVGDTVVIHGQGFGAGFDSLRVSFSSAGGTVSAQIDSTLHSDTVLRVLVPDGAVSGAVSVAVGSKQSNGGSFELAPAARTYQGDVLPLLQAHCGACHGPALATDNLNLLVLNRLLAGGLHGPAIVPRHSAQSLIMQKISPSPPFGARMPYGGPYLSDDQILLIADWIDQGARAGAAVQPQPPSVHLLAPSGGETLPAATTTSISYTATELTPLAGQIVIALDFSTDSGASWAAIATNLPNTGAYTWTVPTEATAHGRVRVTASAGQLQASDASAQDFTIVTPPTAAPVVNALVPPRTVVADTVEIQGSGFGSTQGSSGVFFTAGGGGAVPAAVVAGSWSDADLRVLVPAGAGSGPVEVTVGGVQSAPQGFQLASHLVSFNNEISDSLFNNWRYGCSGCHAGGPIGPGNPGLDVTSYQALMQGNSQHGPVIRPRHSARSLLWLKISQDTPPVGVRMPFGGRHVSAATIQLVADWIDQGARND